MKHSSKLWAVLLIVVTAMSMLPFSAEALKNSAGANDAAKDSPIWSGAVATSFAGGTGTEADPYLISTGEQLAYLAQTVNNRISYEGQYIKLTANIILNDTSNWMLWGTTDETTGAVIAPANEWTAIGTYTSATFYRAFSGNFSAGGYNVRGIYINKTGTTTTGTDSYQGLFGYCRANSGVSMVISNVGVDFSYIHGYRNVGGLVAYAYAYGGSITFNSCSNYSKISVTDSYCGGIVGQNSLTSGSTLSMTNCVNYNLVNGMISGASYTGGITGNNLGTLTNCRNYGTVQGTNINTGGVAGYNSGTITGGCNEGAVSGVNYTGGAAGWNNGTVTGCYNTGAVSGTGFCTGGVVGQNNIGTASVCYNTGTVCSTGFCTGGVAGRNYAANNIKAVINDCFNTGAVSGVNSTGGVVGESYASASSTSSTNTIANIYCCYNVGTVIGSANYTGGVAGHIITSGTAASAYVSNCYYLDICGATIAIDTIGGDGTENVTNVIALTNALLRVQSNYVGFNFSKPWTMQGSSDYPYAELNGNQYVGSWQPPTHTVSYYADGALVAEYAVVVAKRLRTFPPCPQRWDTIRQNPIGIST